MAKQFESMLLYSSKKAFAGEKQSTKSIKVQYEYDAFGKHRITFDPQEAREASKLGARVKRVITVHMVTVEDFK